MKIKIIINEPYKGITSGWATRYIGLTNEMYKRHTLFIYAPGDTTLLQSTFPNAIVCSSTEVEENKLEFSLWGYFLSFLSPKREKIYLPGFNYYPKFHALLVNNVNRESVDLVFYFSFSSYIYYNKIDRDVPKICDFCDSFYRHLESKRLIKRTIISRMVDRVDIAYLYRIKRKFILQDLLILTITDIDKEYIQKVLSKNSIKSIPNGVNTPEIFAESSFLEEKYNSDIVLFCGSLDYEPNVNCIKYIFEHIWIEIKKQNPSLVLQLVGRNANEQVLNLVKNKQDVEIHQNVKDVFVFYQKAKLLLSPMFIGGGMKNKLLESLSVGTPIVTNREGAAGVNFSDSVHGYLGETSRALVLSVNKILRADKQSYTKMVLACIELSREYRWSSIGDRLDSILLAKV
jgi:glycosyltransferase involved in cell wall biosynthesis